jgi:simple sugar transport system permease protein
LVALASVGIATAITRAQCPATLAILLVLLGGALFGALQGAAIQAFALPPFLVTLAGMFLVRGLALMLAPESVRIDHAGYQEWSGLRIDLSQGVSLGLPVWLALGATLGVAGMLRQSRLGRDLLAVGGNPDVALACGVRVARTRVAVHALSGFLSSLAGVAFSLQSCAGNSNAGSGLELEAIAACVVGGIALRGGTGHLVGALVGTALFALIQEAVLFDGRLPVGWSRVVIGLLLLFFLTIQNSFQDRTRDPR